MLIILVILSCLFVPIFAAGTNEAAGMASAVAPSPSMSNDMGVSLNRGPIWRPSAPIFEEIGTAGIYQSLMKIPVVADFASIGAHPDDDDSGMFAYMTKGEQIRVANVISNRGEGGQNAIGPELYQGLGVIRTSELLAARNIDGAEQYFLSAYDFGFSKTGKEALTFWNSEKLIGDMVRFIRTFRPQVVLNHHGSEYDSVTGHGQHQGLGEIVPYAIAAAADPAKYPEQIAEGLLPWTVSKVYQRGTGEVVIDRGEFDPVIGRSYQQIGTEGRSFHRTQSMANVQNLGPSVTQYLMVDSTIDESLKGEFFFDGIDTTLPGIASLAGDMEILIPFLRPALTVLDSEISSIIEDYNPKHPELIVERLVGVLTELKTLNANVGKSLVSPVEKNYIQTILTRKISETEIAILKTTGIILEVFTPQEVYTAGDSVKADFSLYNVGKIPVKVLQFGLAADNGDVVDKAVDTVIVNNGICKDTLSLTIDERTPVSRIFWTVEDKNIAVSPEDEAIINKPFRDYPVIGYAKVQIGDEAIIIKNPAQYRYRDQVSGEERDATAVLAPYSIKMSPTNIIVNKANVAQKIDLLVTVTANRKGTVDLSFDKADGLQIVAEKSSLSFNTPQSTQQIKAVLEIPAGYDKGKYDIKAYIRDGNSVISSGYSEISYPHIENQYLYAPSESALSVMDVAMADGVKIGYVQYNDSIPEYLAQIGINVDILTPEMISGSDFSEYDTIVIGPLAYEFRDDLVKNNKKLLEWVSKGGVLIVQYTRTGKWNSLNVGPYPSTVGSNRVTEEDAEMRILQPNNPIFNAPNKITDADFDGWVQERGLYFMNKWDSRFTPLLASNDIGESSQEGGLVIAEYGDGLWIYSAYAFFRQIPGAVPGGFRLFANMLSLPATRK